MTTPTAAFHEVAAKYGGVDPSDAEAVQNWFTHELPNLPSATLERILEELLTYDGGRAPGLKINRFYPKHAPLPSLAASPPVPLPLFAAGWRELVRQLLQRVSGRYPFQRR